MSAPSNLFRCSRPSHETPSVAQRLETLSVENDFRGDDDDHIDASDDFDKQEDRLQSRLERVSVHSERNERGFVSSSNSCFLFSLARIRAFCKLRKAAKRGTRFCVAPKFVLRSRKSDAHTDNFVSKPIRELDNENV